MSITGGEVTGFKVGDRVIIRSDINTIYVSKVFVTEEMTIFAGKSATIELLAGYGLYRLDIDNGIFLWDDILLIKADEDKEFKGYRSYDKGRKRNEENL